jgi:thiol-disulfide isomerase/thioredoxin
MNRSLVVAFLALSMVASACSFAQDTQASPGDLSNVGGVGTAELAPQFTVPTYSGGEFSLSEHFAQDGRPVFLNLWASWCFPCREEMPDIDAASKRFPEIMFIGVAIQDTRSESEKFLEEVQVSYTIGFDEDDSVDRSYIPIGLPASYIISPDGVILERIFGKLTEEQLAEKLNEHFG